MIGHDMIGQPKCLAEVEYYRLGDTVRARSRARIRFLRSLHVRASLYRAAS
jgi:hypothetical protein